MRTGIRFLTAIKPAWAAGGRWQGRAQHPMRGLPPLLQYLHDESAFPSLASSSSAARKACAASAAIIGGAASSLHVAAVSIDATASLDATAIRDATATTTRTHLILYCRPACHHCFIGNALLHSRSSNCSCKQSSSHS